MGRLTEANYTSRLIKLREAKEAADVSYRDAAFKLEVGEADEAAVTAAKHHIMALDGRIDGLEEAWKRAREEAKHAHIAADKQGRRTAISTIDGHLATRQKAARKMAKAADDLGAAYGEYKRAGSSVISEARPYLMPLGHQVFVDFRDQVESDFWHPMKVVARHMSGSGFDLLAARQFAIGIDPFSPLPSTADGGAEAFVKDANRRVRIKADAILPSDEDAGK